MQALLELQELDRKIAVCKAEEKELPKQKDKYAIHRKRLTAELNALFERWIRVHPGQWLCMRRRWPPAAAPGQLQAVGGEVRACA